MKYGPPALTDRQLKLITDAAAILNIDRRDLFLQRMLHMRGKFSDDDVLEIIHLAQCGLARVPAA